MTGTTSMPGIIPQMNGEMFDRIAASTAENPNKLFLVTCSFMEIYNEVLYDLLDPTATRGTAKSRKDSHIDVKEDPKLGGNHRPPGRGTPHRAPCTLASLHRHRAEGLGARGLHAPPVPPRARRAR